ncbi:MAG: hypothetical protein WC943_00030 [Elusimicrobiota bacterium]
MKCPGCGGEQPDEGAVCSLCGASLKGGAGFQLPSAPSQAIGQQVGKIILPEGFGPKPSFPAASAPGTPKPRPAAPAFPSAPTPPGRAPAGLASEDVELDAEDFAPPKNDIKKLILPGVVLLGLGGYFALRPQGGEAPAPVAQPQVMVSTAPAPPPPPPDPKIEDCKKGLTGQGFLLVEAEAYCLDTPEAWTRVKTVQEARMASLAFTEPSYMMDATIVPAKGEPTAGGILPLYLYMVLSDAKNQPSAVTHGNFEVTTEMAPVEPMRDLPLKKESFRRAVLPGSDRPTVHAFLGVMGFDAKAVAGQMMMVGLKFDDGRLEHQAVVTF